MSRTSSADRTWPALDVSGLLRADEARGRSPERESIAAPERLHAALADFDIVAVDERTPDHWRIFFRTADERDRATAALRFDFPEFPAEPVDIEDEDWAARSQADLRAVRVGRFVVAPPWDIPAPAPTADAGTDRVIVIQPSMGFGTGHHATTRLCLSALQAIDVAGRTAIDVGCGSGILAIAASLLGAAGVVAFDDDPDAVQAARENLELNPEASVALQAGGLGALALVPSGLVLANLTGGLLVASAGDIGALLAPGGWLILSGLLPQEEAAVRAAYAGLEAGPRDEEDGWVCLMLRAR